MVAAKPYAAVVSATLSDRAFTASKCQVRTAPDETMPEIANLPRGHPGGHCPPTGATVPLPPHAYAVRLSARSARSPWPTRDRLRQAPTSWCRSCPSGVPSRG